MSIFKTYNGKRLALFIALNMCAMCAQAKPIKVIALAPHIVEMLFEIGAGDSIVGTSTYADYPEQAKAIPRVGNYAKLNIEKILAMQPDLVIAWKTGNPSDDLQRLKSLGIDVVYSHPVKLTDVSDELRYLGSLTGRSEQASKQAKAFEQQLQLIKQRFAHKAKVKVFYELWSKPITTVANQAWPQQQLEICGAQNPFSQLTMDYPQVNMEQIIIANPSLVIQPKTAGKANPDAIEWQTFKQINAAKHQQVITPNADILHRMSSRLVSELEHLCLSIDDSRQYYQRLTSN